MYSQNNKHVRHQKETPTFEPHNTLNLITAHIGMPTPTVYKILTHTHTDTKCPPRTSRTRLPDWPRPHRPNFCSGELQTSHTDLYRQGIRICTNTKMVSKPPMCMHRSCTLGSARYGTWRRRTLQLSDNEIQPIVLQILTRQSACFVSRTLQRLPQAIETQRGLSAMTKSTKFKGRVFVRLS